MEAEPQVPEAAKPKAPEKMTEKLQGLYRKFDALIEKIETEVGGTEDDKLKLKEALVNVRNLAHDFTAAKRLQRLKQGKMGMLAKWWDDTKNSGYDLVLIKLLPAIMELAQAAGVSDNLIAEEIFSGLGVQMRSDAAIRRDGVNQIDKKFGSPKAEAA